MSRNLRARPQPPTEGGRFGFRGSFRDETRHSEAHHKETAYFCKAVLGGPSSDAKVGDYGRVTGH